MTDDEARKLATRIIDTWPTGPKAYVWRDNLAELEATIAADAYRHLATHADRTPTVAQFLTAYHDRRRTLRPPDTSTICGHCRLPDNSNHTGTCPNRPIPFGEYMNRLLTRANQGNTEAADEIERWERFYGPQEIA